MTLLEENRQTVVRPRVAALDGVRGLFMALFMVYHFGVYTITGAWTGINVFFVLSGFLIARLLISQRIHHGTIDVGMFYLRRVRRLLPALVLFLVTLMSWAMLFADDAVKRNMRGDSIATLGFFMNWRLIGQSDEYFGDIEGASFLRHAWTLSVEEQFYILMPLLIVVLVYLGSKRRALWLVALMAIASALWSAQVGVGDAVSNAHAYYGTDIRAQSLLVGVFVALLFTRTTGSLRSREPGRAGGKIAALALLVLLVCMFVVEPMSPLFFQTGGLLVQSAIAGVLVFVLAYGGGGIVGTLLSNRVLVFLGERSYGLYLWHWPIRLWIDTYFGNLPTWAVVVFGSISTIAVASVSYAFLERPILRGGFKALPGVKSGFVLSAATCVVIVSLLASLGRVSNTQEAVALDVPPLIVGSPEYVPSDRPMNVAMVGDSVPYYMSEGFPGTLYSDVNLLNLARPACSVLPMTLYLSPSLQYPRTVDCASDYEQLAGLVHGQDAVVFMAGSTLGLAHKTADGEVVSIEDEAFRDILMESLDAVRESVEEDAGSQLILTTVSCRDPELTGVPELNEPMVDAIRWDRDLTQRYTDPVVVNALLRDWADKNHVPLLDLYEVLGCEDGFDAKIHGHPIYRDFFHFSSVGAQMVWSWLIPEIQAVLKNDSSSKVTP